MEQFSFAYQQIDGTIWAFASSLLMVSLFFKFNRFWSVRNFDLCLIILLAPSLIMVHKGMTMSNPTPADQQTLAWIANGPDRLTQSVASAPSATSLVQPNNSSSVTAANPTFDVASSDANTSLLLASPAEPNQSTDPIPANTSAWQTVPAPNPGDDIAIDQFTQAGIDLQRRGFVGLFMVGSIYLIRMLLDPLLVRRPLLNPNLSLGGLIFLGICLMFLLFANIVSSKPTPEELSMVKSTIAMANREAADDADTQYLRKRGPGYQMLFLVAVISVFSDVEDTDTGGTIGHIESDGQLDIENYILVLKSLAIISQSLIVTGLILFAARNFNSFYIGVGIASIYLMLPYTAIYTGHVEHALPSALMLWAILCFRKPALSGILIGLATGASYYPVFLIPLWVSFYWDRGMRRFTAWFLVTILLCSLSLIFTSVSLGDFWQQLQKMFGFWQPLMEGLEGIWALGWDQVWRLPLLIAFVIFCFSFAAWPPVKDIGILIAYSAAIMIAVQFWHGFGGGLFAAWYLPMMLLTIFRTNVAGRTAIMELPELRRS